MKVLLAKTSGFCDGVRRAMRLALDGADRHGGLVADGELVHNRQALELLARHGVTQDAPAHLPVLIRAHGISPVNRRRLENQGRNIIDATCVHVSRNQCIAAEAAGKGWTVVLAGDPHHAESLAVAGSAGEKCIIIATESEAESLEAEEPVLFMAQTTFHIGLFDRIAEILRRRFPGCEVRDTICRATHNRQEEAASLARRADVMVVVGGRHSANTRRLAEAGRSVGIPVHLVETADELVPADFVAHRTVAVTSGASTPGWVTQEVVERLTGMGSETPGDA